ncbi:MAG: hypothetical protein WA807_11925 [Steroidobacteraceae bacterium]
MATYARLAGVCASVVILAACAATDQNVKPQAAETAALAQTSICPTQTGTRIPVKGNVCSGFGSSYSGADIGSTGAMTVGGALHLLDPIVTVQN